MRAVGVDYGRKRIGLAVSDATGMLARPWKVMMRTGDAVAVARAIAAEVEALAADGDAVSAIVIGLPRRLSGEATDQTAAVEQVIAALRKLLTIPVVAQDERLTSREAESVLAEREKDWRKRKANLDAMAASIILQDYLDAQPRASEGHEQ